MYSPVQLTLKFSKYYLTATNGSGHGVHSPFVFDFMTQVMTDDRYFYAYESIEQRRQDLLKDDTILTIEDFGAGSVITKNKERKVSDIARSALKPKKFGQLMFRIVNFFGSQTIVELGSSLGITTAYLATGNLHANVFTFEGARQVALVAKQTFDDLFLKNVQVVEGNFDDTLQETLNKLTSVDLAFVDGNHRKEPTIRYFEQLLKKSTELSVFIFDDIHWSSEMEDAWRYIQQHPAVTLTIDLFFIGIVFFRKEQKTLQHYIIRF